MSFYYKAYGLNIHSNIEFSQLLTVNVTDDKADLDISVEESEILSVDGKTELVGKPFYGKTISGQWFINQVGKFLVETKNGKSNIKCTKYKDADLDIVKCFVLGICIAIVFTQRKKIVLHGSSLMYKGCTFMICGDSGAGKSTLSTAFIENGALLLADDISVLDEENGEIYTFPGFPEQKLCKDAVLRQKYEIEKLRFINDEKGKYGVNRTDVFADEKKKANVMFVIHSKHAKDMDNSMIQNGIVVYEVCGADKVNAITDRFFLRELYGDILLLPPDEMEKCFKMAKQMKIVDITRDRNKDTLKQLKDIIIDNLF